MNSKVSWGLSSNRWNLLPAYDLRGWYIASEGPDHIAYRPGTAYLMRRLVFAAILFSVALWLLHLRSTELYHFEPPAEEERESTEVVSPSFLHEDSQERLLAKQNERQESKRVAQLQQRTMLAKAYLGGAAILALLGSLPVLFAFAARIRLQVEPGGTLRIESGWFGRSARRLSCQDYASIHYGAKERAVRRHNRIVDSYWVWFVSLNPLVQGRELAAIPIVFYPLAWKKRPGAQPRPPHEVRELIGFIHKWTDLSVQGPDWFEIASGDSPNPLLSSVVTRVPVSPSVTRSQRSIPLEQVPEALRNVATAGISLQQVSGPDGTVYIVQDSSGEKHMYGSVAEMPPVHRELYDAMRSIQNQR